MSSSEGAGLPATEGQVTAGDVLNSAVIAKDVFNDCIAEIRLCKQDLRAGEPQASRDIRGAVKALNDVVMMLVRERDRVEEIINGIEAGRRAPAIDFERAGHEVRRRMAGLRANAGSGGVSEQSETG